jgi:hypothetical protein
MSRALSVLTMRFQHCRRFATPTLLKRYPMPCINIIYMICEFQLHRYYSSYISERKCRKRPSLLMCWFVLVHFYAISYVEKWPLLLLRFLLSTGEPFIFLHFIPFMCSLRIEQSRLQAGDSSMRDFGAPLFRLRK